MNNFMGENLLISKIVRFLVFLSIFEFSKTNLASFNYGLYKLRKSSFHVVLQKPATLNYAIEILLRCLLRVIGLVAFQITLLS